MTDDELVAPVLAALDGVEPSTLRWFAQGLKLGGSRALEQLANVIEHDVALCRELGEAPDRTTRIRMFLALRAIAADGDLLVRLGSAGSGFWQAVSAAAVALAEERLPAESEA